MSEEDQSQVKETNYKLQDTMSDVSSMMPRSPGILRSQFVSLEEAYAKLGGFGKLFLFHYASRYLSATSMRHFLHGLRQRSIRQLCPTNAGTSTKIHMLQSQEF